MLINTISFFFLISCATEGGENLKITPEDQPKPATELNNLINENGEFINFLDGTIKSGAEILALGKNSSAAMFPDIAVRDIVLNKILDGSACQNSEEEKVSKGSRDYMASTSTKNDAESNMAVIRITAQEFVDEEFGVSESVYEYNISCDTAPPKLVSSSGAG